jgi:hypothetical protein
MIVMTLSPADGLNQRKNALRLLLDGSDEKFTRSLAWYSQLDSNIPDPVWSLLYQDGLVDGNVVGGPKWRLTIKGWIETCRLLREEVDLDTRFGRLCAHLKDLSARKPEAHTTCSAIAKETGLSEYWVFDALWGGMAERIYNRHGASVHKMGAVEIPPHIGIKLSSPRS